MKLKLPNAAATRKTLIERLQHVEDKDGWEQFYETYSRMIFDFALTVHKTMQKSAYFSQRGSFKSWLFKIVRSRVVDQVRKRPLDSAARPENYRRPSNRRTSTADGVPDPNSADLDQAWNEEWRATAMEKAIVQVKKRVQAKHFQIFDLLVVQAWPMKRVTTALSCSVTQAYLAKHRVRKILKKELERLDKQGLADTAALNPID